MPNLATCVDDICFLRSCWCTYTIHAPAMYELHSGRTLMGFPSLGSLGDLRPRQREREPARVLRDAAAGGRAGRRRAVLVGRVPADGVPGHAAAQGAEPDPEPEAARRTSAARRTGASFDLVKKLNALQTPAGRRRTRSAHRELRTRVPDADARPGGGRSARRRPRRRERPTASTTRRPPTSARGSCSRGGSSNAACGSSRSTPAAGRSSRSGTRTTTSTPTTRRCAATSISRSRRCSRT